MNLETYTEAVEHRHSLRQSRNMACFVSVLLIALGAYVHVVPWFGFIAAGYATVVHLMMVPRAEELVQRLSKG